MSKKRTPAEPEGLPPTLDAAAVRLSPDGRGTFSVRAGARAFEAVKVVLLAPLSEPLGLASVRDHDGNELALLTNLTALAPESREALETARSERYLSARIVSVTSLDYQFGAVYWKVETDKGPREFVLQGISQHVRWLTDTRVLLADVDGNRFEIEDLAALDKRSQALVDLVLS